MKQILMLVSLLISFGFAQMQGMQMMAGPGQPMPNYNGFVLEHAEELGISQAKIDKIKEFRKSAGPIMKEMLGKLQQINAQIKQADLDGASIEELLALEEKAEEWRVKAASSKIDCRANNKSILGEEDWQKMIALYREEIKEKPKMEMYDAMAMLGMPLMVHMNDLDLSPEQKKLAMMMPANNMPLMDGIKAEISALYKEIKIASFEGKSKEELLKLEAATEAKRIELMRTEAACRTEIRELLNDEQWEKLLNYYHEMQKDMASSASEVAEKKEDIKPIKLEGANNKIKIGEYELWLEPIVTNNNFYLGLHLTQAEAAKMFLNATFNAESKSHIIDVRKTSLLELGPTQEGVWDFSGKLNGESFKFHISIYKKELDSLTAYLILSPTPNLSGLGKSEVIVYLFDKNGAVEKNINMSWKMSGMEHSTDTKVLELNHDNYNSAYRSVLSSNTAHLAPISFAMVGDWEISLDIDGKELLIPVQMLAD